MRSRYEIIATILTVAKTPKLKTHIIFEAKLSYDQTMEYLSFLLAKGFLDHPSQRFRGKAALKVLKMYQTTPKGFAVLGHLKAIKELENEMLLTKPK